MATLSPVRPSVRGGVLLDANNKPLPVVTLGGTGATPNVDDFPNPSSRTFLVLYNPDAADQDVTITPLGKPDGLTVAPYTITVVAGTMVYVGPFDPNLFNSAGGSIQVTPKNSNKVKVGVLQI